MVVFSPRNIVVAGSHDLVTLVAGVPRISREHGMAASTGPRVSFGIRGVVASKGPSVIAWPIRRGHMGARCERTQPGRARSVAGLAATHPLELWRAFAVIVTGHADAHLRGGVCSNLFHRRCGAGLVTRGAGNVFAPTIASVSTVTEVQISRDECSLALRRRESCLMAAQAVAHFWGSRRRRFGGMAASAGSVVGALQGGSARVCGRGFLADRRVAVGAADVKSQSGLHPSGVKMSLMGERHGLRARTLLWGVGKQWALAFGLA